MVSIAAIEAEAEVEAHVDVMVAPSADVAAEAVIVGSVKPLSAGSKVLTELLLRLEAAEHSPYWSFDLRQQSLRWIRW